MSVKSQKAVHDVTGFSKIRRGDSLDCEELNKQRKAVVMMYKLLLSRGISKEEAARDCGYEKSTLEIWSRIFR